MSTIESSILRGADAPNEKRDYYVINDRNLEFIGSDEVSIVRNEVFPKLEERGIWFYQKGAGGALFFYAGVEGINVAKNILAEHGHAAEARPANEYTDMSGRRRRKKIPTHGLEE